MGLRLCKLSRVSYNARLPIVRLHAAGTLKRELQRNGVRIAAIVRRSPDFNNCLALPLWPHLPRLPLICCCSSSSGSVFCSRTWWLGKFCRPRAPNSEKLEVYECGEPTIGSSFVQFDLRFYVVALLFIIFDVEVAFFFPWATVFGKSDAVDGSAN